MNDEEIIALYFERNEAAIEESENKYKSYCLAAAENILDSKEDAEECFNSALLAVWNSIPPQKPNNLKIYIAKITRNFALNKLKEKTAEKRGGGKTEVVMEELAECVPAKENTEDAFDAMELEKSINRFAKNLPEKERNFFIRRYFFMETLHKIAERYGTSENGAAVILCRVRKKLKKHLEKEGFIQ
ncbi:MAG: sigma-70 family RNA polymerase sigma factor [Oscillospiraceae bacterium]|nr:sigma-70 family RNA polymerase sigma factor [Oscillospiraceae bacterium]